jgi:hypothetical protein
LSMYKLICLPSLVHSNAPASGGSNIVCSRQPHPERSIQPCVSKNPKNAIASSPLRPHVPARDCILAWKSPQAQSSFDSLSHHFPAMTISRWQTVVASSVEESTHENYGAGLLCFHQFCDRHCVPEAARMPASEGLLALFVSNEGAGVVAGGTASSWLLGLELWHSVNGAPRQPYIKMYPTRYCSCSSTFISSSTPPPCHIRTYDYATSWS